MPKKISSQDLSTTLMKQGAPIWTWGEANGSKTIGDLVLALAKGEIRLRRMRIFLKKGKRKKDSITVLGLWCRKVKLDIYCYINGQLYYLVEEGQIFANGHQKPRSTRRSLSEKQNPGETYLQTALRGMEEELGLKFNRKTKPSFYLFESYIIAPHATLSYPGMLIGGPRYRMVCQLHPDLFDPKGYDEYRKGKLFARFRWRLAEEIFPTVLAKQKT